MTKTQRDDLLQNLPRFINILIPTPMRTQSDSYFKQWFLCSHTSQLIIDKWHNFGSGSCSSRSILHNGRACAGNFWSPVGPVFGTTSWNFQRRDSAVLACYGNSSLWIDATVSHSVPAMGITFSMLSNKKFILLIWNLAPRLPGMMVWSEDREVEGILKLVLPLVTSNKSYS
jgi:hypothetical protein